MSFILPKMKILGLTLIILGCISCTTTTPELINLDLEMDLIPEGIAIDAVSETVFINSLRKNKIVQFKFDGSSPTDLISSNQYGYLSGFGMTIKGDTLFALSNNLSSEVNRSVLLLLNLKTGDLINSYALEDLNHPYLNDLVVSPNHDIYITDSNSNILYIIKKSSDELEVFIRDDEIANSNGIAISEDGQYLYLASHKHGIRIINIKSRNILNHPKNEFTGIDGMRYYKNSLIAIVNARIDTPKQGLFRFYLDKNKTAIIKTEKIIPFGENFILPTTFDIVHDYIIYVTNTQLDNFNQETNQIIDKEKLTPYQLLKVKIE